MRRKNVILGWNGVFWIAGFPFCSCAVLKRGPIHGPGTDRARKSENIRSLPQRANVSFYHITLHTYNQDDEVEKESETNKTAQKQANQNLRRSSSVSESPTPTMTTPMIPSFVDTCFTASELPKRAAPQIYPPQLKVLDSSQHQALAYRGETGRSGIFKNSTFQPHTVHTRIRN